MKIGIDISQSAYTATGVGQYTINLVKSLLEQDNENEYKLFFSSLRRSVPEQLTEFSKLIKRYRLPPRVLEVFWNRLHVLPIEKLIGEVDVFHSSDWLEPPGRVVKVTTVHDLVAYRYPETLHARIVSMQKRKLHFAKKETKLFIADSISTKKDMVEILGIDEKRIRVIYLGVSDIFRPAGSSKKKEVLKKHGIENRYVLSVGTREPRKNLFRLVEAFRKLKQEEAKLKDLILVIVGSFGWGEDLEKLNSGSDIKIMKNLDQKELAAFFSAADCFVYPSLYEGFGLPVLEAMGCGAPVVTSDRGSLAEIAGPSCVVDPEKEERIMEGMAKILFLNDNDRKKMVKKGIAWSEKFTWEKTAKETLDVYREAAK
ncbi:MAG: Glycosyl transferase group 1 [Candidatus Gottesmanbacteria bacterium GW2011_GWC2_39_8]|uniref:Glycosyl transferase group 1 n=1 Tax=Candidatus Gottesmanbacteria bacterium GW2011_GWC2_39_8 TaxID=1618450 RepID=A0A0G0PUR5_9BACT|nr:MAG: Glycosyl transferase group 1 [Candidatus Gottesmanbacteria bacterium GW2011_GWC2_39_8]